MPCCQTRLTYPVHRFINPSKTQQALYIDIIDVILISWRIDGFLGESVFEQMRPAGFEIQAAVEIPASCQFELLADKVIGPTRGIAQIG
ncbi:hypothetical protein [Methylobacter svalbardensis]|uniref:hypothetical protein n=1 Tax=Methylobacter svalbardensis TaxID=3080016 RepID=UPI0030EB6CCB